MADASGPLAWMRLGQGNGDEHHHQDEDADGVQRQRHVRQAGGGGRTPAHGEGAKHVTKRIRAAAGGRRPPG